MPKTQIAKQYNPTCVPKERARIFVNKPDAKLDAEPVVLKSGHTHTHIVGCWKALRGQDKLCMFEEQGKELWLVIGGNGLKCRIMI